MRIANEAEGRKTVLSNRRNDFREYKAVPEQ